MRHLGTKIARIVKSLTLQKHKKNIRFRRMCKNQNYKTKYKKE